ncbi:MAG: lysophospholipid acyltransferase family protein [Chloroflexota bacterium]|nr:lysophospholipid acyltransferase family protein [Chloroflexota bacterium]
MTTYSLSRTEKVVNVLVKGCMSLICRVDAVQLENVPRRGPLIIITNHINFLEAPIIYTHLQPCPLTGFSKIESWDHPIFGPLFNVWGIIPIRREDADMSAIRRGVAALQDGQILAVAPEGTRSGNGRLQKAHAGVVVLALLSGAPLLPVLSYGGESYRQNLRRLRRTDFYIVVGQPFKLDDGGTRANRKTRAKMITEIMYQMAHLLPPQYRGEYADVDNATQTYLRFLS